MVTPQNYSVTLDHAEIISQGYRWLGTIDNETGLSSADAKEKFEDLFGRPRFLNIERYTALPRLEKVKKGEQTFLQINEAKLDVYGLPV